MSLRARLLAGMVVLVAAGLLVAAFVTYEEQRSFLLKRVDQQVLSALPVISAQLRLANTPAASRFSRRHLPSRLLGGEFRPRALAILPPRDVRRAAQGEWHGTAHSYVQLFRVGGQARCSPPRYRSVRPAPPRMYLACSQRARRASAIALLLSGSVATRSWLRCRCERHKTLCIGWSWSKRWWRAE